MGGDSRESSPDWLRTFQAPTQVIATLSSASELSGDDSPSRAENIDLQTDMKVAASNLLDENREKEDNNDEKFSDIAMKSHNKKSPDKKYKKRLTFGDGPPSKRKKIEQQKGGSEDDVKDKREEIDKSMDIPTSAPNHSVCELSSDSELNIVASMVKKEEKDDDEESKPRKKVKKKSPKKQINSEDVGSIDNKRTNKPLKIEGEVGDVEVAEDVKPEKASLSTLPLVLPDKVNRSKALVECEGESIDLGGDMGAVGRVMISETSSKESEMFLDLKGTIYKTVIIPSKTFCVVSIGQSEAKIEAIMNDYIQLKPQSNVYEAETMVEGTLEGFNFDSDDEADKTTKEVKGDPSEGAEEQPNKKVKGKAEKKPVKSVATKKSNGGKQPKKRKPPAAKKGKAKK